MGWSAETAVNAYFDTIKLCKMEHERRHKTCFRNAIEPRSTEFMSALAAGMNAQLIVEVCCSANWSTIALAAAARQTGGRLVCILPKIDSLQESVETMKGLGLEDSAEFLAGDANELLPLYKNIDFAVVDCNKDDHAGLLDVLKVNPRRAVVLANNLFDRKATTAYARRPGAKSVTLPIGKGIELTRITDLNCQREAFSKKMESRHLSAPKLTKNRWVVQVDERTGEEHMFMVCRKRSKVKASRQTVKAE